MKQDSRFRLWVQELWFQNKEEHEAFKEPTLSLEEYFGRYKYWLKREYQYQLRMNMIKDKPKFQVEFAPGAFDDFDGTQEELDELVAEIHRMVESGEFLDKSTPLEFEELDEEDQEVYARIIDVEPRNLQ